VPAACSQLCQQSLWKTQHVLHGERKGAWPVMRTAAPHLAAGLMDIAANVIDDKTMAVLFATLEGASPFRDVTSVVPNKAVISNLDGL
jgi:hypothetical protein